MIRSAGIDLDGITKNIWYSISSKYLCGSMDQLTKPGHFDAQETTDSSIPSFAKLNKPRVKSVAGKRGFGVSTVNGVLRLVKYA